MKVAVILTYRGSYARLGTFLNALRDSDDLELQLIVGASALLYKYGEAVNYIEADGFDIAARLHMVLEGENPISMAKSTGIGMMEIATVIESLNPDVAVIIGDRYESIGFAAAVSYLNVPLVHVQGGEVTGSIDEKIRHAITKFADYHFVANEAAGERVIRMGEEPDRVFVTGCPSIDMAAASTADPTMDLKVLTEYRGVGPVMDLDPGSYLVTMFHPVTTEYADAQYQVTELLAAIYELKKPTMWFWPNVDAGSDQISKQIRSFRERFDPDFIHFFTNLPPDLFYKVLFNSRCFVGSSSVGVRECSFLGVPVVNVGSRQTGRLRGPNLIDTDHDRESIKSAVLHQIANGRYESVSLYGDGQAGPRMAGILEHLEPTLKGTITY